MGCSTNTSVIHALIKQLTFGKISLWRRHAIMVEDGALSHTMDYVKYFLKIPNLKGHSNHITGSRVMATFLNGLILSIGGASTMEGLRLTELPRLVYMA